MAITVLVIPICLLTNESRVPPLPKIPYKRHPFPVTLHSLCFFLHSSPLYKSPLLSSPSSTVSTCTRQDQNPTYTRKPKTPSPSCIILEECEEQPSRIREEKDVHYRGVGPERVLEIRDVSSCHQSDGRYTEAPKQLATIHPHTTMPSCTHGPWGISSMNASISQDIGGAERQRKMEEWLAAASLQSFYSPWGWNT